MRTSSSNGGTCFVVGMIVGVALALLAWAVLAPESFDAYFFTTM